MTCENAGTIFLPTLLSARPFRPPLFSVSLKNIMSDDGAVQLRAGLVKSLSHLRDYQAIGDAPKCDLQRKVGEKAEAGAVR